MDSAFALIAIKNGAEVLTETKVADIVFKENAFEVKLNSGELLSAKLVIGSHGKRDTLDKKLNRDFIKEHTGYLGVKYHLKIDYPNNEVGLDNFDGGYCGIVKIEEDKFNLIEVIKTKLQQDNKIFTDIDGVRVENAKGWWLLRASNTQAVLVMRAEALTQENLDDLVTECRGYLT